MDHHFLWKRTVANSTNLYFFLFLQQEEGRASFLRDAMKGMANEIGKVDVSSIHLDATVRRTMQQLDHGHVDSS